MDMSLKLLPASFYVLLKDVNKDRRQRFDQIVTNESLVSKQTIILCYMIEIELVEYIRLYSISFSLSLQFN